MSNIKPDPPVVMTIGGMDPSGGAGLCADIQTLSDMGCHAAPVVTALTVQDTSSVKSFKLVDVELIRAQMQAVFDDISPSVIKTGMLGSREVVLVVAEALKRRPEIQLIVDPVLSSNNNDSLSEHSLSSAIKELLMPVATLISPNIPEAAALAGSDIYSAEDANDCAALLYDKGGHCDCLITGAHAESRQVINRYYQHGKIKKEWRWERLPFEYHGSGCTLASAIAAGLAHGLKMEQAVGQAQEYVKKCLVSAFKPGQGQHVPDRLCLNTATGKR